MADGVEGFQALLLEDRVGWMGMGKTGSRRSSPELTPDSPRAKFLGPLGLPGLSRLASVVRSGGCMSCECELMSHSLACRELGWRSFGVLLEFLDACAAKASCVSSSLRLSTQFRTG